MEYLKQSTAVYIQFGPFVDDSDGKTPETALSIAQADVRLSKNGAAFAQKNSSTATAHDENAYYRVHLDSTDTGTLGRLRVAVYKSGALLHYQDYLVVTANVWDTLCSTDRFDVEVAALANDIITAASFDESTAFPIKSADSGGTTLARAGDKMDLVDAPNSTGVGVVVSAIWDKLLTGITTTGSIGKLVKDYLDAAISSRSTYAGGAVDSVTNPVTVGTNQDKTGYALTVTPPTASDIATAVWQASERTLSSFGTLVADIWGATVRSLTDKAGFAPSATAIRQEIDSASTKLDAAISTRLAASGYTAPDNASITAIKAKTDNLPTSPASVGDIPSPADIWAAQERTLTDKTGFSLDSAYDSAKTAAQVSDIPTAQEIEAHLAFVHGVGAWQKDDIRGTGSLWFRYTVRRSTDEVPLPGVRVTVTSDEAGQQVVAWQMTDELGESMFRLDPGVYYFWRYKEGYRFTDPDIEVVEGA